MDALPEASVGITAPPWGDLGRVFTLVVVSGIGKLVLNVLNTTKVLNRDQFIEAVQAREPGVGLLTIANHTRWEPRSPRSPSPAPPAQGVCRHTVLCSHPAALPDRAPTAPPLLRAQHL